MRHDDSDHADCIAPPIGCPIKTPARGLQNETSSAVVAPGRTPLSRSPWRTYLRSVSAVQPILPAIDSIAAHCDGYWSLASNTMRIARSITSTENFGDFLMLAPFSIEGASSKPGAIHSRGT